MQTNFLNPKRQFVLFLAFMLGGGQVAVADFMIEATDSGWYDEFGFHDPVNANYFAGWEPDFTGNLHRNFMVFDTSGITETATSATVRMYNPSVDFDAGDGYVSPDPSEIYRLYSVATDVNLLVNGNGGVGAFDDLGEGTEYGEVVMTAADNGTFVEIELNQAALARINDPNDGPDLFVLGGAIATLQRPLDQPEWVFGFSTGSPGTVTLEVTTATIPEPSAFVVLMLPMLICGSRRIR